jgi:hypothetical protein
VKRCVKAVGEGRSLAPGKAPGKKASLESFLEAYHGGTAAQYSTETQLTPLCVLGVVSSHYTATVPPAARSLRAAPIVSA